MFSSKPRIPKRRTAGDLERQMPSNYKGMWVRQPELKVQMIPKSRGRQSKQPRAPLDRTTTQPILAFILKIWRTS